MSTDSEVLALYKSHRWEIRNYYLQAMVEYLENVDNSVRLALLRFCTSRQRDEVFRLDFYIDEEEFGKRFQALVDALRNGDRGEWAKLLYYIDDERASDYYHRAKAVSPFKNHQLIFVHHGVSWLHLEGSEAERLGIDLWNASALNYKRNLGQFAIVGPLFDSSTMRVIQID